MLSVILGQAEFSFDPPPSLGSSGLLISRVLFLRPLPSCFSCGVCVLCVLCRVHLFSGLGVVHLEMFGSDAFFLAGQGVGAVPEVDCEPSGQSRICFLV